MIPELLLSEDFQHEDVNLLTNNSSRDYQRPGPRDRQRSRSIVKKHQQQWDGLNRPASAHLDIVDKAVDGDLLGDEGRGAQLVNVFLHALCQVGIARPNPQEVIAAQVHSLQQKKGNSIKDACHVPISPSWCSFVKILGNIGLLHLVQLVSLGFSMLHRSEQHTLLSEQPIN